LKNDLALPEYDAKTITEDKDLTNYFLQITEHTTNYKSAANWTLGTIKSYLNEQAMDINDFHLNASKIAELIALIDQDKLSNSSASQLVFPELVKNPNESVLVIAERLNVIQTNDVNLISGIIAEVLAKYPDKVEEYKNGKKGLLGLFVGEVMKASKGKADPKTVKTEVIKALS
jgi:aspartyl-tRNA(Asn)/glutamyl-tRNA(Gln) amidotransferase subunit B